MIPMVSAVNSNNDHSSTSNKINIPWVHAHWFNICCPFRECRDKKVIFTEQHHKSLHCNRDENGNIRWKCPVQIFIDENNKSLGYKHCDKISNSWYNYAGHIASHPNMKIHSWRCGLPVENNQNLTQNLIIIINGKMRCGEGRPTKDLLLAHMKNVHKSYNVIHQNKMCQQKEHKKRTIKEMTHENVQKMNAFGPTPKRARYTYHHSVSSTQPSLPSLKANAENIKHDRKQSMMLKNGQTSNNRFISIPNSNAMKSPNHNNSLQPKKCIHSIPPNNLHSKTDISQFPQFQFSFEISSNLNALLNATKNINDKELQQNIETIKRNHALNKKLEAKLINLFLST